MIKPLRAWHRRVWIALATLLPLLVVLALASRQSVPAVDRLPASDAAEVRP